MRDRTADPTRATRRQLLLGAGAIAFAPSVLIGRRAQAMPEETLAAIKKVVGDVTFKDGKVKLDLPPLVENGNAVPVTVSVESPMTANDHVKAIHIFTEKNPQPNVASFRFGSRAGKASVATRMRLADTQNVTAIAEMSDGTVWSESVEVVITLAACMEGM